jgi:aspartyl/asparaginyl beta-hydroxylase (cupin superfamily)
MWQMLCDATRNKGRQDWRMEFSAVQADGSSGRAHWEARYRFSVTKRLVHNVIDANFTFTEEGLIASHKDTFDIWRWSRQALGLAGFMLGWMPFFRRQMRQRARESLNRYMESRSAMDASTPDFRPSPVLPSTSGGCDS